MNLVIRRSLLLFITFGPTAGMVWLMLILGDYALSNLMLGILPNSVLVLLYIVLGADLGLVITKELFDIFFPEHPNKQSLEIDKENALKDCETRVEQIKALLKDKCFSAHPNQDIRQVSQRVITLLDWLLFVIKADKEKRSEAFAFLNETKLTEKLLRKYVLLSSRGIHSAKEELAKAEAQLPGVEKGLREFYYKIHQSDRADLAAAIELLDQKAPD